MAVSSRPAPGNPRLFALVLSTVLMQIVVAVLLKELADRHGGGSWLWLGVVLSAAMGLNVLRFAVWGYTHKHYPLSRSYPLTALFFPCILAISAWYGDPVGWQKIAGVLVIMAGIVLMNLEPGGDG
jgi:drug/metabolite transporter (DMT)-like permease